MTHQFTYPKVTEIRRVSLEIGRPPIPHGPAGSQRVLAPSAGRRAP
jgi:hypothetical protein